jgi:hypothetical protein
LYACVYLTLWHWMRTRMIVDGSRLTILVADTSSRLGNSSPLSYSSSFLLCPGELFSVGRYQCVCRARLLLLNSIGPIFMLTLLLYISIRCAYLYGNTYIASATLIVSAKAVKTVENSKFHYALVSICLRMTRVRVYSEK